jgi:Chaperone of endosialidase
MQKFSDTIATTKADGTIEVLPSATVTVYLAGTTTPATIFSTNAGAAKANPFLSDTSTGRIEFYAADGRYDLRVDKAGFATVSVSDILLEDPDNIDDNLDGVTISNSTLSSCIILNPTLDNIDSLSFSSTPDALTPRRMAWNTDEATADLSLLDGTVLQVGQELHYRARNTTASTIANGAVVWATGTTGNSGRINIGLAVANNSQPGKTVMGLLTHDTAAGADGYVTAFGKVRGVNTTGAAVGETWADGDILYLHPTIPGALTKVKPTVNGHSVVTVALVIHTHSNGTLFVRPTADSQESDEIRYTPAGTGAVATTVQSKLRETVSPNDLGAVGNGVTVDTAAIAEFFSRSTSLLNVVGSYLTGSFTLANSINCIGSGYLIGAATVGAKPTRGTLVSAGSKAARLALLESYYPTVITITSDVTVRGNLDLRNCLIKSVAGANLIVEGVLKLSNVSFHNVQAQAMLSGVINASELISSDSISVGLYATHGGTIVAPSSIVVYAANRGIMAFYGSRIDAQSSEITNNGLAGVYAIHGSTIVAKNSTVSANGGVGVQAQYNSHIEFDAGVSISNAGAGVNAESNSSIYAYAATISSNVSGVFVTYEGFVQATGSTIQGNTGVAVEAQGGTVDVMTATIGGAGALQNNGGAVQLQAVHDGFIRSEASGGTGKTFLTASSYSPLFGTVGYGRAYIGTGSESTLVGNNIKLFNGTVDASNYEALFAYWSSNIARLGTLSSGTGTEKDFLLYRNGSDALRFRNGQCDFYQIVRPGTDNAHTLGTSANRWSTVYAATGTINTSDEREKQDIAALNEAEKRVAGALKGLIKTFRFKDAVQAKGDGARIHVGVIAQEVIAAFQAEGIDPMRYAIVCYDEWSAELDDDGNETRPAGNRYGVRYEELLAFIVAAL